MRSYLPWMKGKANIPLEEVLYIRVEEEVVVFKDDSRGHRRFVPHLQLYTLLPLHDRGGVGDISLEVGGISVALH